jgi:RNA polymerase sigma-70 factor (ECF subfamily)
MLTDSARDADLLRSTAQGDAEAFGALFERRRGDVYRYALHMTGSPSIAEDVTQEVFLAVMRDAGRYEASRATVTAWLCGIARNHVLRRLERDRPMQPLDDEDALFDTQVAPEDPLGDLTAAERVETLRRAVQTLPLRYREAVVLCDLQEMSYADAATAMGCAVGTVRSRVHRGRALLASKLSVRTDPGTQPSQTAEPTRAAEPTRTTMRSTLRVSTLRNLA